MFPEGLLEKLKKVYLFTAVSSVLVFLAVFFADMSGKKYGGLQGVLLAVMVVLVSPLGFFRRRRW
jgi:hypothetical protein